MKVILDGNLLHPSSPLATTSSLFSTGMRREELELVLMTIFSISKGNVVGIAAEVGQLLRPYMRN